MDFASLMSAQISKAKEQKAPSDSSKKYVKRSELEAQRQAAYIAEQKALEEARLEKQEKKRRLEEEEAERNRERDEKRRRLAEESRQRREEEEEAAERARRKRLGLPELPPKPKDGSDDGTPLPEGEEDMTDEELVQKLRELGEPVRLFGENHRQQLRRYRRLTGRDSSTPAPVLTDGPIPTTLKLVPEVDMKVDAKLPKDEERRKFLNRQLASYFTMVLKEWEIAMATRSESVQTSFQGKQAFNAMVHARENLRPFFKKLEKGDIEDGIMEPVVEIVNAAQERRYVDANDAYLRLSIGKA
jgi:pre-mRNA-splicing factor 18